MRLTLDIWICLESSFLALSKNLGHIKMFHISDCQRRLKKPLPSPIQFHKDDELDLELGVEDEEEIKAKYGGKISKEMSGPMFQVFSACMKNLPKPESTLPVKLGQPCLPATLASLAVTKLTKGFYTL